MNLRTLWKFWNPPNYENFCSEFSDFFPDPPPCWENLIDYHVQIRRASLTPFSVFGFPWKLLTASVQFTPYGLISVLQTASFFNLSEKGTFTDISLSIINICLHIQTDKKIIDVFHIRTFLWLVVDSQLSLSKALPLSWR